MLLRRNGSLEEEELQSKLLDLSISEMGASFSGIKLQTLPLFCFKYVNGVF